MTIHIRRLWLVFLRLLIGLLAAILALSLFFAFRPGALRASIHWLPIPGVVDIPTPGPPPPPPQIPLPRGSLPGGHRAFRGAHHSGNIGCGFLLELADGRQVGVSAAHTILTLPAATPAEFRLPDRTRAAGLQGQIGRGRTFFRDNFTLDFVLWAVAEPVNEQYVLRPDPRGHGQPGESVVVISPADDGVTRSKTWPGVVMKVTREATWIQLVDSFDPSGYSGCPVVSQHTGQVIGMIVAGGNMPPVVLGLNPVGSLVANAVAALSTQR